MYRDPLVSNSFIVPPEYRGDGFILKPLTIEHVDLDYAAVMASVDAHGRPPSSQNLTKHQNLIDLGWHQKEFQKRSSFTYTVLTTDGTKCLGCVYIYPSSAPQYDAEVSLWVTQDWYSAGGDNILFLAVKNWLTTSWTFKHVFYPDRD